MQFNALQKNVLHEKAFTGWVPLKAWS